ncbi:MAG: glutamine-hydrolyzing carbamoyl-phosphate synthase small subunit [Halieaceae bacterium]|nr:glutamine-hydrolyzing carbamoyl-phosphate synthase small subunit [Halieaceae bacterium]
MEASLSSKAVLALEDGSVFKGTSIGADGATVGEVVFNTAMTGYQEILTDPSYARQIVTLTYPHIGNTGTNLDDEESERVWAAGLVVRDLPLIASNFRNQLDLSSYLIKNKVVAISEIDTRRLTRVLREKGSQKGCLLAGKNISEKYAIDKAIEFVGLKGMDLAKKVTVSSPYEWINGSWTLNSSTESKQSEKLKFHVVAYDFGVKRNILRMLVDRGCRVTVVPATTSAEDVVSLKPDGVFLSNGPGDPEPCKYAISAIQEILSLDIPVFGICLGHQLLGLASGAVATKMKFGHHGANHPVQSLEDGSVLITSQNHGFSIDEQSLPDNLKVTHRSLFDGTLQGFRRTDKMAFSFQGHPEASPGPHDLAELFDHFIYLINKSKRESN